MAALQREVMVGRRDVDVPVQNRISVNGMPGWKFSESREYLGQKAAGTRSHMHGHKQGRWKIGWNGGDHPFQWFQPARRGTDHDNVAFFGHNGLPKS
jgi:hypothetical protein